MDILYFVPDNYLDSPPVPVEVVDVVNTTITEGGIRNIRTIIFNPEYNYGPVKSGFYYAFSFGYNDESRVLSGEIQCYEHISRMIEVSDESNDENQYVFSNRWVVDQSTETISGCLFASMEAALDYLPSSDT